MPLSINPIINIAVSQAKTKVLTNPVVNTVLGNIGVAPGIIAPEKQNVDNLVNRLSGGVGSGLSGATNSFNSKTTSNLPNVAQSLVSIGGIAASLAPTNSTLGNAISKVSQVGAAVAAVSGIAGQAQKTAEAIASGGLAAGAAALSASAANPSALANNLLQAARSINLPSVGPNFADPEVIVRAVPVSPEDWRVRISAPEAVGGGEIVFPVLPNMTLSHKANYTDTALVHTNYLFLAYKNSQAEDITISCEWPVETLQDIAEYIDMVRLGKALTKMFYGSSPNLGNPPPICTIKGYGEGGALLPDTPIVVKSFSIDLKDDVNYVEDGNGNWIPRLSSISFVVSVIYNRNTQRSFNLLDYRFGAGGIRY